MTPWHVQEILRAFRASTGLDIQMRVGVHIGDVTHGVVGSESPRFCASLGEVQIVLQFAVFYVWGNARCQAHVVCHDSGIIIVYR